MALIDAERTKSKELQEILGVSHQTIATLQKEEILKSIGAGKFNLAEAVQSLVAYIEAGRSGAKVVDQKRMLLAEQHRRLKLANDLRERASIPIAEAELVADEAMLTVRSNLEGLAGRLGGELAGISDPALIKDRLAHEHRRVLQACSDRFARLAAVGPHGNDHLPAAKSDGGPVGERVKGAATRNRRARSVP